ncbi:exonuclease domain-containing protein [Desulfuromonas sp. TF]|uniref:exonuclease domain-containing protein n=1 Tax=Desulfuromonas sp. TF TaxID=1232410 RepID=UPI00040AF6BB|nr:exonuclease domain-containing protein [Desulfuromonas sp. TF]
MTADQGASPLRRRKSLRSRMIVSLMGLAVLPLLAALTALFFIVRNDIGENQGRQLAQEAEQLAGHLRAELNRYQQAAAALAASSEVKAYLSGTGPLPEEILSSARQSHPGLQRIALVPNGGPTIPGDKPSPDPYSEKTLDYRVVVTDTDGGRLGTLEVFFAPEDLKQFLDVSKKGEGGGAVLFTAGGDRLAGNPSIPVPPYTEDLFKWTTFEADDESYFAGVAAVEPLGSAADRGWFLAVVQPASQVYGHFFSVSGQVAFLLAVFGIMVVTLAWRMADQFLRPILEIRRGAEIVSRINLAHRIELDTGDELEELALEFNLMAENLAKAYDKLEERVREATLTLQEERNRLATVLRTMVDGVVVANEAAETILMNPRARIILGREYTSGIGAPLSRIFPSDRLSFHLKRLRRNWNPGGEAMEEVVFPLIDGKLLKGSLSVIPGPDGERAGFLLVFRDLSAPTEEGNLFEETLREMPQLLRGPVATSRFLVETIQRHREMPEEKQQVFLAAVAEEMDRLGERVTVMEEAAGAAQTPRWSAVPSNPLELVEESLISVTGISVEIEAGGDLIPPVLVEPFSWVASLRCVLQWIARRSSRQVSVAANIRVEDGTVVTTFRIGGSFAGDLAELESLEVCPAGEVPLPLGEAVRRNRGELWTRSSGDSLEVRLALLQAASVPEVRSADGLIEGEPEFYNFDLFLPRPIIEREDLLQANLADLEYVVVDTETTGLQLSRGDKIISISGVRIRRGRVQNADIFNTLVNPGRPIPPESTQIHHIEDHMVADAPSMDEVYPQFMEYVGDAILVAHNAAFDKKCLDMAAAAAGLPQIDNPILDTLLLSYALHQGIEGHSLDAIAERMGITIEGRHTSLGDARAAAQVFLGLLSLLPGREVRTLAEAKSFCDRHLLLRWQSSRF